MLGLATYRHQIILPFNSTRMRPLDGNDYRWVVLLLLWFNLSAPLVHSQASVRRPLAFDAPAVTIVKRVQEVSLAVTVTDKHGHFVNNLTPSDLLILDNDDRADQVTYFESCSNLPLRIALVIDTSDSETYRFDQERKTAAQFLKRILRPDRDSALLISFNQEVHATQPPTSDLVLLSQSLKRMRVGGETAIYDAVSAASQELGKLTGTGPSRRVIVLITDGDDNRSQITLKQAADMALRNETTIHVISTNQPSALVTDSDQAMKELASATGGTFLRADGDVGYAFSEIEKGLRSQYAIGYKPPQASPDGQFHRLTILGSRKLRFFHRTGYFAK